MAIKFLVSHTGFQELSLYCLARLKVWIFTKKIGIPLEYPTVPLSCAEVVSLGHRHSGLQPPAFAFSLKPTNIVPWLYNAIR